MTILVLSQSGIAAALRLANMVDLEPYSYSSEAVADAEDVRKNCLRVAESAARWESERTAAEACGLLREALKALACQEEPDGLTDRMDAFLARHAAVGEPEDPAVAEARRRRDEAAVGIVAVKAHGGEPTKDEWLTACSSYMRHRRIAGAKERT